MDNEKARKLLEASINLNLLRAKMRGDFPNPVEAFYGRPYEIWNGRAWVKNV